MNDLENIDQIIKAADRRIVIECTIVLIFSIVSLIWLYFKLKH